MTCTACDEAQERGDAVYPYRIGNEKIGWGAILIVACKDHAKLTIDKLNGKEEEIR